MKTIFLFLLLTVTAYSQELPEYRDIKALEGKTKVYVAADTRDRETIIKELKKEPKLSIVDKPDDAEFVLAYRLTATDRTNSLLSLLTGQLDVYFTETSRVIAWSREASTSLNVPAKELAKKFLKDWRRAFIK
jgi:hypothetical protein